MRAGSARIVAGAKQVALTLGAVVGVLCLVVTVAGFAFGVRPLVFLSGSMSPTIDTGALAIARTVPAEDLRVGDIVSVPTPAGQRVTHRIVDVQRLDGQATLRLKGDANEAVDAAPYQVVNADVVLFSVPEVGFLLAWLTSPVGLILLGLYAAMLLSVLLRGTPAVAGGHRASGARRREVRPEFPGATVGRHRAGGPRGRENRLEVAVPAPGRHRAEGPRRRSARSPILVIAGGLVLFARTPEGRHRKVAPPRATGRPSLALPITAATVIAGGWVAGSAEPTLAAWADQGSVSGATQTAYTVPAPDGSSCAVLAPGSDTIRGVNLSWPANAPPQPPLSYAVDTSPGVTILSADVVSSGSDEEIQVRYDPSVVANQDKVVTVTATPALASAATWTGPVTSWTFRTGDSSAAQPICDVTPG